MTEGRIDVIADAKDIEGPCQAIILHEPRIIFGKSDLMGGLEQYKHYPIDIESIMFKLESDSLINFTVFYTENRVLWAKQMYHAGSFTVELETKAASPTPK